MTKSIKDLLDLDDARDSKSLPGCHRPEQASSIPLAAHAMQSSQCAQISAGPASTSRAPAEALHAEAQDSNSRARQASCASALSNCALDSDFAEAQEIANICQQFTALTEGGGYSLRLAAVQLGKPASYFSGSDSMLARYRCRGIAGLLPARRGPGAGANPGDLTAQIESLGWFIPAAKHFYMLTNCTCKSGSVPEALRRTISLPNVPGGWKESDKRALLRALGLTSDLPVCPEELRNEITARQRAGQPMVPTRIARQITATKAQIHFHRHKTNFNLDYLNSPGGMRLFKDPHTGEHRLARAMEIVEGDDATINFPVCIPWNRGGTPSADKFGVMVGRFQWLVFIDVGTSQVLGYSYTARPRSSYRGEDVLSAQRVVCRQHGIPNTWRFERGVWKSKLVTGAVKNMGSQLETVYSPHQKPFIEGLFSVLWTKLSVHFPGAHVGRFQGEHEAANDLLTACRLGNKDPKRHFPMLAQVIAAFDEAIAEKNRTPVNSTHHGRWVPCEKFAEQQASTNPPRRMDPEASWIFSPWVREWTVKGQIVGGRVPLFEQISVPFDFSAHWLPNYDGAKVRCYFDPAEPKCSAKVCLAQPWNGHQIGTILGNAETVSDTSGYVRLVMGWGDDPQFTGARNRQQAAAAVRREVRAIIPNGRGATEAEERDGLGQVVKVESSTLQVAGFEPGAGNLEPSTRNLQRGLTPAPDAIEIDPARLARSENFQREHALEFLSS